MIPSAYLPLAMGIDSRKSVTVRLEPELHARAYDDARRRKYGDGDPLLGPFCAWCVRQLVTHDWLSPENREFLEGILRELGRPWDLLELANFAVSVLRKEMRAGRVRPLFWSGPVSNPPKEGAR